MECGSSPNGLGMLGSGGGGWSSAKQPGWALVLGRRKVALGAAGPLRYGFPLAPLSFTLTFTTPTTREKRSDTESK